MRQREEEYEYFERCIPFSEVARIILRPETMGERVRTLIFLMIGALMSCAIMVGAFYAGYILFSTILLLVPVFAGTYAFSLFKAPDLHMTVTAEGKNYGVIFKQEQWETFGQDLLDVLHGSGVPVENMVRD